MKNVRGIIFDIDGTLILNQRALPGAVETIHGLKKAGYQIRLVSNITSKTPKELSDMLQNLGFDIVPEEIQTSVSACINYVNSQQDKQVFLAVPKKIEALFSEIKTTQVDPDFVILGDLDEDFNYDILNTIFNYLVAGAELIVFHKNLFYFRDDKKWLDSGAFTLALEKATGKTALVMGKPSPTLFENAIKSMKLDKADVIVVGDDVSSDVQGARNSGLNFLLVGNGKYHPTHLDIYRIDQNNFLPQIHDLITLLKKDESCN